MVRGWKIIFLAAALLSCDKPKITPADAVGQRRDGGLIVSTAQLIRPAGQSLEFGGRPIDLALSRDGQTAFVKDRQGVLVVDIASWQVRQTLLYDTKEGATMYGLAVAPDGGSVYVTTTTHRLRAATFADGKLKWGKSVALPGTDQKKQSYPCGVAISADGATALVCLSMNGTLAIVDLANGKLTAEVPVGVAPYGVVFSKDGTQAYVTNWGGRRAVKGDKIEKSANAEIVVDERGVASTGTLSIVDLQARKEVAQVVTGLHPADLKLSNDGKRLYVANANSDTVSVIDTGTRNVVESILVRPDPTLPFGSASNALALSSDGKRLFVANGGNNAVAVVRLNIDSPSAIEGFIPAGWYPGAVAADGANVYIANVKGLGSRREKPRQKGWSVHQSLGTITRVPLPSPQMLETYTRQVMTDARVPESLAAWEKAQAGVPARPVPDRIGEPSVFEHVVYVIKENRTYDQVLGDIGRGNSEKSLCVFGRDVTPNHHKLAEEFVLLDNFYCNGVVSTDGHAWATEGTTVDYLEKSFGGWIRSYPFGGDDPLAVPSSGFLWDNALLHGRSFRNYGEMNYTSLKPDKATFTEVYNDFRNGTKNVQFTHRITPEALRKYSSADYPGWNLKIPDAIRLKAFLKEFEEARRSGSWPNLITVYLPSDHTSGTSEGAPTPAAMVADNDLALGQLVEAISHSPFWATTCIFIIEDDPQAGFDHVDGHRSVCLVASPHTRRRQIVSRFYNQTSVLHTMELILGLPPMNQHDAMAPAMHECFTDKADLRPYTALPNKVPLDQMNPRKAKLAGATLEMAIQSEALDFDLPDRADENTLNRILWHAVKGVQAPYPAEYAGAHGKGLGGLKLKPTKDDDD
jgi:YVTN family beta-propeller protein